MIRIERKTFVDGVDVTTMTDDQLFERIRECEAEINSLEAVENKPLALAKKIYAIKAAVADIVVICNARTPD
jgi:hypothetical protein